MRTRDLAASASGFLLVLIVLVAMDDRVGSRMHALMTHGPRRDLSAVSNGVSALGQAVLMAARDQSFDHAPLLVFGAFSVLLVFLMLRT